MHACICSRRCNEMYTNDTAAHRHKLIENLNVISVRCCWKWLSVKQYITSLQKIDSETATATIKHKSMLTGRKMCEKQSFIGQTEHILQFNVVTRNSKKKIQNPLYQSHIVYTKSANKQAKQRKREAEKKTRNRPESNVNKHQFSRCTDNNKKNYLEQTINNSVKSK